MKSIKLDMDEWMHRRLKLWSYANGFTMQSALRHMIGEKCGHNERDAEIHNKITKDDIHESWEGYKP